MKKGPAAFLTLLIAFGVSRTWADPPADKTSPSDENKIVHASFIGEGGGFVGEGDPSGQDYQQNAGKTPEPSKPSAKPAPAKDPAPARADTPAPEPRRPRGGFIVKDPATKRYEEQHRQAKPAPVIPAPSQETAAAEPPSPAKPEGGDETAAAPSGAKAASPGFAARRENPEDRKRYSLWEGLSAPLSLPSNKINDASADQASTLGRQDYDGHILGAASAAPAQAAAPADRAAPAHAPIQSPETLAQGETFVTVSLDLKATELKDAVAGLSATGFRADARFAPVLSGMGESKADVSGWMPSGRVAEALKLPQVLRVRTAPDTAQAPPAGGPTSQLLIGIRVHAGLNVDETYDRVARELASESGLRISRTVGYQPVPGSRDLALVVLGEVPARGLARLMSHPDVLKVMPAPAPASDAPRPRRNLALRFLSYVMGRAPVLLAATLLLLLAPVADRVGGLLKIFVPYR